MRRKKRVQTPVVSTKPDLTSRVWGPWTTFGLSLAAEVAYLIVLVLVSVAFVVVSINSNPDSVFSSIDNVEGFATSIAGILGAFVVVGLVVLFIRLRKGMPILGYLGLKGISLKTALVSLGVALALIAITDGLSYVLGRPIYPQSNVDIYRTSVWPVLLWIVIIIIGPISEEIVFRGFLFEGFRKSHMGIVLTIILTSLAWTLLHLGGDYDLYYLSSIFVSGLLMGFMRVKTRSIWSPLLMHSFANLITTIEIAINLNGLLH
jgi:uncharacterized protein